MKASQQRLISVFAFVAFTVFAGYAFGRISPTRSPNGSAQQLDKGLHFPRSNRAGRSIADTELSRAGAYFKGVTLHYNRLLVTSDGGPPARVTKSMRFCKTCPANSFRMLKIGSSSLPSVYKDKIDEQMKVLGTRELYVALVNKMVNTSYVINVAPPGSDIQLSGRTLVGNEPWEKHVTYIFLHVAGQTEQRGECIVMDVGANLGCTITLPAISVGCRVLAFELQTRVRNMLKTSVMLNGGNDQVSVYNGASSTPKQVCYTPNEKLFAAFKTDDQEQLHGVTQMKSHVYKTATKECANTDRLSTIMKNEGVAKHVDFMKLDVDGPERDVLDSLGDLLKQQVIKNFVIEMYEADRNIGELSTESAKKIYEVLVQAGYYCMRICHPAGTSRFDKGVGQDRYMHYTLIEREAGLKGNSSVFEMNCERYKMQLSEDAWCWVQK